MVGTFASATNLSRRTEEWSDSGSGPWSRIRLLYMRAKWAMPWAERPVKIKSTQPNKRWRIDGTPGPSRRTTAQASIAAHDRALAVNSDGDVDHGPAEEERLLPDLASPGAGQPPVLHNQDAQTTSPRAAALPGLPGWPSGVPRAVLLFAAPSHPRWLGVVSAARALCPSHWELRRR